MNFSDEPKIGEPLACEAKIINSGKSFALDVSMPGGIQTSPIGLEDAQNQFSKKAIRYNAPHSNVLFPGIEVNLPSHTEENLTGQQVFDIQKGTLKVYLFVDLLYHDIFKELHRTHICGHYVPDTARFEDCGTEAN